MAYGVRPHIWGDTIGGIAGRIAEHWRDLRLEPPRWRSQPAVWQLLYERAARAGFGQVPGR